MCLDPQDVERRITPATVAILGVDSYGIACPYDALAEIGRRRKLKVLFDSAPAFGDRRSYQMDFANHREALRECLALLLLAVAERPAELSRHLLRPVDVARHGEDRVGVEARRQHLTAAIEDVAALGRRLDRPHLLALGAVLAMLTAFPSITLFLPRLAGYG